MDGEPRGGDSVKMRRTRDKGGRSAFPARFSPGLATAAAILAFSIAGTGLAAETRLQQQVVAGGGGHAASATYTLGGTLGQPAAGPASSATVALEAGFWTTPLEVIVEPDGGFYDWMESLPPEQQPPPNLRGPSDIAAGDGMTNLLKYALGLPPVTPAAEAAPVAVVFDGFFWSRANTIRGCGGPAQRRSIAGPLAMGG